VRAVAEESGPLNRWLMGRSWEVCAAGFVGEEVFVCAWTWVCDYLVAAYATVSEDSGIELAESLWIVSLGASWKNEGCIPWWG